MCVNFKDLHRACPKDAYLLPQLDQLVDASSGYDMLSIADTYSVFNRIRMHPSDEVHIAFYTNSDILYYKVMSFILFNGGRRTRI